MAQIYTWDRQGFEGAYWRYYYKIRGCGASTKSNCKCNDTYITYSRNFFETNDMFRERAEKVIKAINLPQGSSVLVMGCGLGYIMEELQKLRMIPYGFDNSNYIKGVKNQEKVKFEIPDIDALSNNIKQELNRSFGVSEFDCVITEDLLPSHDSYDKIFSNCESVLKTGVSKKRIVHIVQTDSEAPFASHTLTEWKNFNQNHTWLNQNGDDI